MKSILLQLVYFSREEEFTRTFWIHFFICVFEFLSIIELSALAVIPSNLSQKCLNRGFLGKIVVNFFDLDSFFYFINKYLTDLSLSLEYKNYKNWYPNWLSQAYSRYPNCCQCLMRFNTHEAPVTESNFNKTKSIRMFSA